MLDQKSIATYFGNDQSMLRRFTTVFVAEAPGLVNNMDESLHTGDLASFAIQAHTLKSQLNYFGFPELVSRLREMEKQAENGEATDSLPQVFLRFSRDFREAYAAIYRFTVD